MKELTCIQCPNGCRLCTTLHGDGSVTVTGNQCRRGEAFGIAELTDPRRSVTTTVQTAFPELPWLPVRTDGEVKKADVPLVLSAARRARITARLRMGDVAVTDAGGTGVNLIATMDV